MRRVRLGWTRRDALVGAGGALTAAVQVRAAAANFQIACMTLPYAEFSFERSLEGIRSAGYRYVAWGTRHREARGSERTELLETDSPISRARMLARQCFDTGLEPIMMFS